MKTSIYKWEDYSEQSNWSDQKMLKTLSKLNKQKDDHITALELRMTILAVLLAVSVILNLWNAWR